VNDVKKTPMNLLSKSVVFHRWFTREKRRLVNLETPRTFGGFCGCECGSFGGFLVSLGSLDQEGGKCPKKFFQRENFDRILIRKRRDFFLDFFFFG
jgi:hypothetical protein